MPPQPEYVPAPAVREQLARILTSRGFTSSARLVRFLTHIVNRTLDQDLDSLKEFAIAMEVFDRTAEYDPNVDAIVRVEARRLRAKLKAYYEMASDPVHIELRPGSYVPTFQWSATSSDTEGKPEEQPPHRSSVAVLPFVNMSSEPEQEYFCDGISEEIINSLTHVPGLNVIARTSAFQFKGVSIDVREIGRRLSADVVIEGSVRKAREHLRITAQAIETASGHHLWSRTFGRELKDVFVIQEEIAGAVASLLQLHAPARSRSVGSLDAYTTYLRARFLIQQQTPEALRTASAQLQELTAMSPDFAPGHSGLAEAVGLQALFGLVSGRDVYGQVKEYAERGYALDPTSGETCTVLGGVRVWFEHQWSEGEKLFDRAISLQPGYAAAHVYRGMAVLCRGRIDEAESSLHCAMQLDPLSAGDCARMAYVQYLKGQDRTASDYLQRAFELDRGYPEATFYKGLLQFRREEYEEIVQGLSLSNAPLDVGLLAAAQARLGRRQAAQECVQELRLVSEKRFVTPLAEALAAVGMRDFDLAFAKLDEAIEHRTNFVALAGAEPFFDPLRADSRFQKLLKRLNLSD